MKSFRSVFVFISLLYIMVRSHEPVDLKNVDVLYFKKDYYALSTRGPGPVPQLLCEYNPMGDDKYLPTSVLCENKGLDDKGGIIWKCDGDMDSSLLFDKLQVSCEGFSGPGDRFVKKGSCALTYSLRLSAEGEKKLRNRQQPQYNNYPQNGNGYNSYPQNGNPYSYPQRQNGQHSYYSQNPLNEVPSMKVGFGTVLVFVLAFFALLKCCLRCTSGGRRQNQPGNPQNGYNNNNGGYYGGGGGGGAGGDYPGNQNGPNYPPPPNNGHLFGSFPGCAQGFGAGYGPQVGPPPQRRFGWLNWGIPLGSFLFGRWSANRPLHSRTYQAPPVYQQPVYQQPVYAAGAGPNVQPVRQNNEESRTERRTGVAETVVR